MPDTPLQELLRTLLPAIDRSSDIQELAWLLTQAWQGSGTDLGEPRREFLREALGEAVAFDDDVADTSGRSLARSDRVDEMLECILSRGECGITVSEHEPVVVSWFAEPFGERKVAWPDPRYALRLTGVRPGTHRLIAETGRLIWSGALAAGDIYLSERRAQPWRLAAATTPTTPPAQSSREEVVWGGLLRLMIIPGPPPPAALESGEAPSLVAPGGFGGVLELRTPTAGDGHG